MCAHHVTGGIVIHLGGRGRSKDLEERAVEFEKGVEPYLPLRSCPRWLVRQKIKHITELGDEQGAEGCQRGQLPVTTNGHSVQDEGRAARIRCRVRRRDLKLLRRRSRPPHSSPLCQFVGPDYPCPIV